MTAAWPPLGFLISYAYFATTDLDELTEAFGEPQPLLLADSGAYSAKTLGITINLAEYADWIKRWNHRLTGGYFTLDAIGDPTTTTRNTAALRRRDLNPIPIYHVGTPRQRWTRLTRERTDQLIGIGGIVSAPLNSRNPRMAGLLRDLHHQATEHHAHVHGLGVSSWPLIKHLPWTSVDTSSAGSGFRYGRVTAYDPYADTWPAWNLNDRRAWGRHGWLVREYNLDPQDFYDTGPKVRIPLMRLASRSWARAAATLPNRRRVYAVDSAIANAEPHATPTAPTGTPARRAHTWNDGNRHIYLAEPHPTPSKNIERAPQHQDGNRWHHAQR